MLWGCFSSVGTGALIRVKGITELKHFRLRGISTFNMTMKDYGFQHDYGFTKTRSKFKNGPGIYIQSKICGLT